MPDTKNVMQRQEEALTRIAKALNLQPRDLRGEARGDPALGRAIEMENIANAVEQGLTAKNSGDLRAAVLAANDAALGEMPGVGEKSLETLREWAKSDPGASTPQPSSAATNTPTGATGSAATATGTTTQSASSSTGASKG